MASSRCEPLLSPSSQDSAQKSYTREARRILQLAGPVFLQSLMGFSANIVSLAFVGHLGSLTLSQAVLGLSAYNVTGLSVLLGVSMGMETCCTQAFGAGKYLHLGVLLQRALLICSCGMACTLAVWTQLDRLLLLAGQHPDIVAGAVPFCWLNGPALYCYVMGECLKRYLMAQATVTYPTAAMLVAGALSPFYNWLLVHHLDWGLTGAALANDAVQATFLTLLLAMMWAPCKQPDKPRPCCWGGWSWEAFKGWGEYLTMAAPNTAACFLEWGLYEGLILVVGLLPNPQMAVSAMGISLNTTTITYCLSLGFAGAASTRVGTAVGAGEPAKARLAFRTAIGCQTIIMSIVVAIGCTFSTTWARIFTHDPQLVALAGGILPVVFLSELAGGLNAACAGVMRGVGRQSLASFINAATYWGIGLPVYVGLWTSGGLYGIWYALAAVIVLTGVSMLGACCWLDFEQEAQQAVSKQGVHLARQSWGGSARPHTFTTSLHPALYEQVHDVEADGPLDHDQQRHAESDS